MILDNGISILINNDKILLGTPYHVNTLTIEKAEQLWQELMNLCHEYRRQEQIKMVNN